MNLYYSFLGRLLEERTPIGQEGYFILYEDNRAGYSLHKLDGIELVNEESFINALVEGCKVAIRTFANRPENNDVYVFNLYADEHNSFYIYMNTLDRFKKTLEKYQTKNSVYYETNRINSLKYSQGDFDFQFWQDHMGDHGRIVESFEKLAYLVMDLENDGSVIEDSAPVIAFEAGIIKSGYYVLALKAVLRLISEYAFESLNKTENFIAFASTGNDYIDYSIMMRKSIDQTLFYSIFPDIKEKDLQFGEIMKQNQHLSVGEFIEYWSDAIHSDYYLETPFTFNKSEMEVFLQLEHFGNALAQECIERLNEILALDTLERKEYERIYFYVEALHFSGKLTDEQVEACNIIAKRLTEKGDVLKETSQELLALTSQ